MIVEPSSRVGGSFRDPSGYVFWRGDRVFRAVSETYFELFRALVRDGTLERLVATGLVVPTREVDGALVSALGDEHPGHRFLEHQRVEPITYPYEWCVSMLADAGLHTLHLQQRLLDSGHALKDASAFNVQFPGPRPVFIDLTSIERPARLDLWYALGQFGQMFTIPLLLAVHHGWDLRSYFMGQLGGRNIEQAVRSIGPLRRYRPRYLLDLTLPLLLGRMSERSSAPSARPPAGKGEAGAQRANLGRLRRKLAGLSSRYRPKSEWTGYVATCSYDRQAEDKKKAEVRAFLERTRPARVLDAGCNTGDYSLIAAASGAQVIALDSDHDSVELFYRRLRKEPATITPIVASLCDPSPALGFRGVERAALAERIRADCVLALALIHHLVVVGNLSLSAARDLLCDLTRRYLVLEFVPPADPMFQRLLRFRAERFDEVTLERCREVFGERFSIVAETAIEDSGRTLLFLERRPGA